MTIKSSSDLRTFQDIEAWLDRLNREWPQRLQVARHIAEQVADLSVERPRVLELACGSGYLAGWLLRTLPGIRYIGFDRSPYLLDYARTYLGTLVENVDGDVEIHLRQADLNGDDWIGWLREHDLAGRLDAVVSLQSFHDLGGESEQRQAYRRARQVLRPGGRLISADLLLDPADPHPRRLPAYRHLDLLREAGFEQIDVSLQIGEFAVFLAVSPEEEAAND